jgi:uncharacterized membrane protein YjdF
MGERKAIRWTERPSSAVFYGLEAGTILAVIYSILRRNRFFLLLSLVQMVLLTVPFLFERMFGVRFSAAMEIVIMSWIAGGIVCGTVLDFFYKISCWDLILHTLCGFITAGVGFALPEIFDQGRLTEPPMAFRFVCAVCFSMAVASLWELVEYATSLAGRDVQHDELLSEIVTSWFTQQDGVSDTFTGITEMTLTTDQGLIRFPGYLDIGFTDTLQDMSVHFGGTLVFCAIAAMKKGRYAAAFIPERVGKSPSQEAHHPV